MATHAEPPARLRRSSAAFVCLGFIWLAIDLPLYVFRDWFGVGSGVVLLWFLMLLPWIGLVAGIAFAYAVYAAIRMMFSENEFRQGVVAIVLCIVTVAATVNVVRWWLSPAARAQEKSVPEKPL